MKSLTAVFAVLLLSIAAHAQVNISRNAANPRPRVFIEESDSWEIKGSTDPIFTSKKGRIFGGGGSTRGGAKPRTAEIMKRFDKDCQSCIVTMNREKADFIVRIDHEGGEQVFGKDNKLAVFNRDGDLIESGSFSRSSKAVETACGAIAKEFRKQNQTIQSDDSK